MQRFRFFLLTALCLLLFAACDELDGSNLDLPGDPAEENASAPEGSFGVSETFGGPYLSDANGAVRDASDERVLEVAPGGKFFVQIAYTDPDGLSNIDVNLVNASPEGLAGTLDPSQRFFTLGGPSLATKALVI